MLERKRVQFSGERLQREILASPLKKEPVRSDAFPRYGKGSASSLTNLFTKSAGYNFASVIAGLEKRRAELIALTLEAVAKAQEARERLERAENRLEQETNYRLVVERRLRDLEKDRMRQLQAVKIEGVKTQRAMMAHGEVEARLKVAESRIKVAEKDTRSLTLALARENQKRAEAEATARAAKEKAHQIESLYLKNESAAHENADRKLVFGLLVYGNKSQEMTGTERKPRNADETRRQQGADERRSQQGADTKRLGQKQNANLRSIPRQAPLVEGDFTTFSSRKSVNPKQWRRLTDKTDKNESGIKPRFVVYSMVITLLLFGMCWLLRAAFF